MTHPICESCRGTATTKELPGEGYCALCGGDCDRGVDDDVYAILLCDNELIRVHNGIVDAIEDLTEAGSQSRASFVRLKDALNAELERRGLPY